MTIIQQLPSLEPMDFHPVDGFFVRDNDDFSVFTGFDKSIPIEDKFKQIMIYIVWAILLKRNKVAEYLRDWLITFTWKTDHQVNKAQIIECLQKVTSNKEIIDRLDSCLKDVKEN